MSPAEIRERIAKLLRVTQARGATAGEEANAQTAIQTLRAKLPKEEPHRADPFPPPPHTDPYWFQNAFGGAGFPFGAQQAWGQGQGGGFGAYRQYDQEKATLRADNARLRTMISNLESCLAASVQADEAWQALREEIIRILKQKSGLSG